MSWPAATPLLVLAAISVVLLAGLVSRGRFRPPVALNYLWAFFLAFAAKEWISLTVAVWVLALLSFRALKEYFSLVDIRLADRWGIWGAFLSIPFMIYMVQIGWYGLFIISIPVYVFLIIPFLVAVGGENKGCVLSIGTIDLGLFLLVYCLGHIAYLLRYSTWLAIFLVLAVALCDAVARLLGKNGGWLLRFVLSAAATMALALLLRGWLVHPGGTSLPFTHAVALSAIIPALVIMGSYTVRCIEDDLGIAQERPDPGRGRVLDAMKTWLFVAPVVFHYLRWFLGWE